MMIRRWTRTPLALTLALLSVGMTGCIAGMVDPSIRGPFRGQVVDAATGQPIEGAVAVAVWWEVIPTPVQGQERFYDAAEGVTGPDGRFEIPRAATRAPKLGVQPAQVSIFAPGYQEQRRRISPPDGRQFVDPTVVEMRRLTTREERIRALRTYSLSSVPDHKIPLLRGAMSRERTMLGLEP